MKSNLKNEFALVTGASSGIGRAVAVGLAKQGAEVALMARNSDALHKTQALCKEVNSSGKYPCFSFDLTEIDQIPKQVEKITQSLGKLSILINNAGKSNRALVQEAELERWDKVMDLNLRSMIHLTRYCLPELLKNSWGGIVNIASISGKLTQKSHAIYTATKHGVMGFTGSLYEDVREKNIKVSAICPGFVDTPLVSKANLVRERMIQPEDVSDTVNFILMMENTACPVEIILRPQRTPYPDA